MKNILIRGGKIVTSSEIFDASGRLIFPGFIDVHTHFDLHVAGTVTCDDFASGTMAAVSGGTTTIIDFGTQYKGETLTQALRNWQEKAARGVSCDYGFHMSITEWNENISRECQYVIDEGITTFKLYMTYDTKIGDKTLYKVLKRLKDVGGITGVHCENDGLISALQEEYESYGGDVSCHYKTRPACAEAEAIGRLLHFCEAVNIPVIDVHLTCEEGLNEIRAARKRGQTVYKELGRNDFRKIPGGMPGVETRGELIYSEGVAKGRISAEKMCELLCENPAKLYGLYPRKGVIQEGSDADIVILNPSGTKTITHSLQVSRCDYSPFEGMNITGTIESVYLRGVKVSDNGRVINHSRGKFLRRKKFMTI